MKWASPVRFSSPVVGALLPAASFNYLLTEDGTVYNVDIAAGSAVSIFRLDAPARVPPALIPLSGVAVFGGEDGRLVALRNGAKAWGYVPDDACAPDARVCHLNTTLQGLAASGSMVYASYSDRLVAIDSSGIVQWENKLASGSGGPAATDGARVYVMDGEDLVAYKSDRTFAWRVALGPYFLTGPSPDPSGAYVFAASTDGYVLALNASSGAVKWYYPLEGWAMSPPASDGVGAIFSDNSGTAHAVDLASGQPLWSTSIGAPSWGAPLILTKGSQSIAVFATRAGKLAALDTADGSLLWSYPLSDWASRPVLGPDGRTLYVSTADSQVWAVYAWPMCTIDSPSSSKLITSSFELQGRAWSWPGVKNVKVKVDSSPLPDLSMNGSGTFTIPIELGIRPDGDILIQCIAEDLDGLLETDAVGYKSIPTLSPLATKSNLTLTLVPNPAPPGGALSAYVRDEHGYDVSGVLLEMDGRNVSIKSPASLAAPSREGTFSIVARKTGFTSAASDLVVRNSDSSALLTIVLLLLIILAACAGVLLLFKKKPKEPTDYSKM